MRTFGAETYINRALRFTQHKLRESLYMLCPMYCVLSAVALSSLILNFISQTYDHFFA